jgi:hypothetical protein
MERLVYLDVSGQQIEQEQRSHYYARHNASSMNEPLCFKSEHSDTRKTQPASRRKRNRDRRHWQKQAAGA